MDRATLRVSANVLQTKVDAYTSDGRTKLTALATIDLACRKKQENRLGSEFGIRFQKKGSPPFWK